MTTPGSPSKELAFATKADDRPTPRPGFVLDVDRSTPPILFHHGEGFRLEKLPAERSRVVYGPEAKPGLRHPDLAIEYALDNPIDQDPLATQLYAGMKLTIAFDDVSLPLPQMAGPDVRQRVIEAVLDRAAAAGVDDVHLIAALGLHRRMTESELRHAVGDRVYDAFAPEGNLYNHDAEDPEGMVELGTTRHDEPVSINRRVAESDLLVYVNINAVSMDGGWKSTATGLTGYSSLRHHHNPETLEATKSLNDRHNSALHTSIWRQGEVIKEHGPNIFHIETTINTNAFGYDGPLSMLQKREWEWNSRDRMKFMGMQAGLKAMTTRAKRKAFMDWRSPYEMTSVQAGDVDKVHEITLEKVLEQHITPLEFHPVHHPSYIDFFEQVLPDTTDPAEMAVKYEQKFAEDEWYKHLYRTSYAYHGVHPFYAWYWGAHALKHVGAVIIVGGDPVAVRRLGFKPASTMMDALEMASDVVGPQPTLTHLHNPPVVMADVT